MSSLLCALALRLYCDCVRSGKELRSADGRTGPGPGPGPGPGRNCVRSGSGTWPGERAQFRNFGTPSICLYRMKLHSSNLVCTWILGRGLGRLANSGFGHSGTPSPLPVPSPPSPPLPPSRSQWAPPLNQLWGLGSDVGSPVGSGAKPQPTNDLVHLLPKGAALVATVSVHFHNNKFKFLYKHKTA